MRGWGEGGEQATAPAEGGGGGGGGRSKSALLSGAAQIPPSTQAAQQSNFTGPKAELCNVRRGREGAPHLQIETVAPLCRRSCTSGAPDEAPVADDRDLAATDADAGPREELHAGCGRHRDSVLQVGVGDQEGPEAVLLEGVHALLSVNLRWPGGWPRACAGSGSVRRGIEGPE